MTHSWCWTYQLNGGIQNIMHTYHIDTNIYPFIQSIPVPWRLCPSSYHQGLSHRMAILKPLALNFAPHRAIKLPRVEGPEDVLGCWPKNPQQFGEDVNLWIRFNPKMTCFQRMQKSNLELKPCPMVSSSTTTSSGFAARQSLQSPRIGSWKIVAWRGSTVTAGKVPSLAVAFHQSSFTIGGQDFSVEIHVSKAGIRGFHMLSPHNWEQHGTSPPIR